MFVFTGLRFSKTPTGALNVTSANFAASAAWNQSTGTLQVQILTDLNQLANYNLSFNLVNPDFYQASPVINATVYGALPVSMFTIPKPVNNSHALPLNVQGVLFSQICQSTPSSQATNTITVTFATFLDIIFDLSQSDPSRRTFTVLGLLGSPTRDSLLHITTSSAFLATTGSWTQATGALIVSLAAAMKSATNTTFSFQVQNPPAPQGPSNTSVRIPGGVQSVAQTCGLNYNPLIVAGFTRAYAFQTTSAPSQPNTITLQIVTSVNMATGSTITLSGLTGSPVTAEQDLALAPGSNASVFGSTSGAPGAVRWSLPPLAGLDVTKCCDAVVSLNGPLSAGVLYVISFVLTNPASPQSAPALFVASTLGTLIQSSPVTLAADKAAPLFVPGFSFKNIGQSSPFSGSPNRISVTFAATCVLEVGTVLSIQLNSVWQPSSSVLQLKDQGNFLAAFGATGSWDPGSTTLSLTALSPTVPYLLYSFSFPITNSASPQDAPSVSLQAAGGAVSILPAAMLQAAGYDAAFYTVDASVDAAKVCQAGTWNRVTAAADWAGRRGLGFVARGGLSLIDSSCPPFALEAIWIQPSGSLTFFSSARFVAGSQYVARVRLKNPAAAQDSQQTYIETLDVGILRQAMDTDGSGTLGFAGSRPGDAAILKTYDPSAWHTLRIGQSSPFPLAQNTLTLTLVSAAPLQDLGGGAQVTLLGLAGTSQADDPALPLALQGAAAGVFLPTGQWSQSGILVLTFVLGSTLAPGSAALVSFTLQNSVGVPGPQGPQSVVVAFFGNVQLPDTVADPDADTVLPFPGAVAGDAMPLVVYPPQITLASAGQSSALQGASNVITVTAAANFPLTAAAQLTISGVLGPISGLYNAAAWAGMTAAWDSAAGTVTVSVTQAWPAGARLVVQFTVVNPAAARGAGAMGLQLTDAGASVSVSAPVQGAAGDAAPFLVYAAGFLYAFIAQSTPYPAAANVISAAVQLTADLGIPAGGAQLVLQGLTGPPPPFSLSLLVR